MLMTMTATLTDFEPRGLRYSFDEYIDLAERGMFEGKRVMLVDGEVVEMAPQGSDHVVAQIKMNYKLLELFDQAKFTVQQSGPYRLDERNDPEPDILVRYGSYSGVTGIASDCALVVEISDTTLRYDRQKKLPRYARNGVKEVWILNCVDRQLEIYRNPHPAGRKFTYDPAIILKAGDFASPLAAKEGAKAPVAEMLP